MTENHCLGQSAVSGVSGWKGGDLSRLLRVVLESKTSSESVFVWVFITLKCEISQVLYLLSLSSVQFGSFQIEI